MKNIYFFFVRVFFIVFILFLVNNQASAQKSILSIAPNSGLPGHTNDVVIRGVNTNFKNGVSIIDFGNNIEVLKFVISNPETGIASIKIASNASVGFRKVRITTGNEIVELENAFEIFIGGGNFRANLELMPFQSGALSDFDISKPQTQPILFFANLYNDNTARNIRLFMTFFKGSGEELFTLSTDRMPIAALQVMRLTNRDLVNFKVKKPEGNIFLDELTSKGTIPPGEYIYKLTVTDENGVEIGGDQSRTVVTNPVSNPELISPGAVFSDDLHEIYTSFPLFQWFGQADKYDFALYQLIEGQSPEEVTRNQVVFKQEDITGNSMLYPVYAEKLIEGKIYAWQINGKIATAKGTKKLPSEVFRFMFNNPANVGGDLKNISKIMVMPQQIELKLGDQYKFTAIIYDLENRLVTNLTPTWKVVPLKGTVTNDGLFTAGQAPATLAVVAQIGSFQDFATVVIKSTPIVIKQNTEDWMIELMLKQLFGLSK